MKNFDKILVACIMAILYFSWLFHGYFTTSDNYVYILIIFISPLLLWLFFRNFTTLSTNVKASLIGLGALIVTALITNHYAQKLEIQNRHFLEKSAAYKPIFKLAIESMRHAKAGTEIPEELALDILLEIRQSLLIWGGQDVIKAWMKYEEEVNLSRLNVDRLRLNLDRLMREIRKDLGHDELWEDFDLFITLVGPGDWKKITQDDENDK